MRVFQDQFEKMLQNNLDPAAFISRLIAKKVKQDLNIDLSKEQQRQLQRGLQAEMDKGGLSESLHIEIHDKNKVLVFSGHSGDAVSIDIGDIGCLFPPEPTRCAEKAAETSTVKGSVLGLPAWFRLVVRIIKPP